MHQGTPLPTVVVILAVPPKRAVQSAPPALWNAALVMLPLMLEPVFSYRSPVMTAVSHSVKVVPLGLVILLTSSDVAWILLPTASLLQTPLAVSPISGEAEATAGSAIAARATRARSPVMSFFDM